MKRCPSCQKTYPDDAPDYCSNDGMRLVNEESVEFDPEKTVMASGPRGGERVSPPTRAPTPEEAPPPPQPFQAQEAAPGNKPPAQWQAPGDIAQQWQAPGNQPAQQGWSPSPLPQTPAPNWGGAQYQQPAASAPYSTPYSLAQGGRSRALAIAALVTGACAVTIMTIWVVESTRFAFTLLLILAILGIGFGVAALILTLKKPSRFGGIPLAIIGLATGTAALVYYFTL
jgi:hypothetical protein